MAAKFAAAHFALHCTEGKSTRTSLRRSSVRMKGARLYSCELQEPRPTAHPLAPGPRDRSKSRDYCGDPAIRYIDGIRVLGR